VNQHPRITSVCLDATLVVLFIFPALAIGGVHSWVSVTAAMLASVAMALLITHQRSRKHPLELPWFGAVLLGVTAWTALQMVPLPMGLLKLIAPTTAEVINVSLATFKPSWHAISLDPGATLIETLKIGTAALAFIVAHNRLQRRSRRTLLWVVLVAVAGLLVLLGLLGTVLAPGKPLLFYTPAAGKAGGLIATSFVNPNHGAAFLSMATLMAIGLALAMREIQRRALLLILAVFLGSAVALTLSRGGMLALAGSATFFGFLLVWARRDEHSDALGRAWPWFFGFAGATAVIAAWLAPEALLSEMQTLLPGASSWDKLDLWPAGLSMLKQNLWVGVGRGAFFSTFPHYMDGLTSTSHTFSHLENQYLHLPIELGLPIGGGLLLLSGVAWVSWLRRSEFTVEVITLAAVLLMLALHNIVDFNLELLGIALPAAIIAGALSAATWGTRREAPRRSRGWKRQLRWGALLSAPGLLVLFAILSITTDSAKDAEAKALKLVTDGAASAKVLPLVKEAILARPGDYLPHLTMARALSKEGKPEAVRWLNQALFLNPRDAAVHLEAARLLFRLGHRRQGLVECRLALQTSSRSAAILGWALKRVRNAGDLEVLLATSPLGAQELAVRELLRKRQVKLALKAAKAMRQKWPYEQQSQLIEIEALLANNQGLTAQTALQALLAEEKEGSSRAYLLLARATEMVAKGAKGPASAADKGSLEILGEAWRRFPASPAVGLAFSRALIGKKQPAQAIVVVSKLLKTQLSWPTRARAHEMLAAAYRAAGRPHRARYEAEQAKRIRKQR